MKNVYKPHNGMGGWDDGHNAFVTYNQNGRIAREVEHSHVFFHNKYCEAKLRRSENLNVKSLNFSLLERCF